MLTEAEFWVAIAFLVFAGVVWWVGGFGSLTSGLDSRAKRIRGELDEAKRLREEAAGMLEDYKRRRTEAEAEAEAIVAGARAEAERIAQEAHTRMEEFVARRTAAAEAKIAQAETQAAAEVRAAAADAAVRVSETVMRQQLSGQAGQDLVGRGLAEVRRKLQ